MPNTIFLDSFVYAHIARDAAFADEVRLSILERNQTLVVSTVNLIEILPNKKRLDAIQDFIVSVPFAIAYNVDEIVELEVTRYPEPVSLPFRFDSTQSSFKKEVLRDALEENLIGKVASFRKTFEPAMQQAFQTLISRRDSGDEAFKRSDEAQYFLLSNLLALLVRIHPAFIQKNGDQQIDIEHFRVYAIQLLVIFEDYYQQRKNGRSSDIGDLLQLGYAPYIDFCVFDNAKVDTLGRLVRRNLLPWPVQFSSIHDYRKLVKRV